MQGAAALQGDSSMQWQAAICRHVQISLADRRVINTFTKTTTDTQVGFLFELILPTLSACLGQWWPSVSHGFQEHCKER